MIDRAAAVAYARTWSGTPYVKGGRVRGAGCDCGTLLAEYLIAIGACSRSDLDEFLVEFGRISSDWYLHTERERYAEALGKFAPIRWVGICVGTPPAQPGDIALFRVALSRVANHGAIILAWPRALHAFRERVAEARPALHPLTAHMPMILFDPWKGAAC